MYMSSTAYERLTDELEHVVQKAFSTLPKVVEEGGLFRASEIPSASSDKWISLKNVVCVLADLKGSTQLNLGRYATTSARLYRSSVEGAVKIFSGFEAEFIDIQGDGGFALFWGEKAYERAFCAAMTVRMFSESWEQDLPTYWKSSASFPDTGFKVGVHAGTTLVKKVGTRRNTDQQEAIWAGKVVNFAAKCAQSADRHELLVTETVWEEFADSDFAMYGCDCRSARNMWHRRTIDRLPADENSGFLLTDGWCERCAPMFVEAIMRRDKSRGGSISEFERKTLGMNSMERGRELARDYQRRRSQGRW